jgi:hypothetical protein
LGKSKCFRSLSVDLERERFASTDATTRTQEARFYERGIRAKISLNACRSPEHLQRPISPQQERTDPSGESAATGRRRETARLRLLAMRKFDP